MRGPDVQMDSKHAATIWLCLSQQRTFGSIDFSWLIKSDRSFGFVFCLLPSFEYQVCSLMLPVSERAAYKTARRGTCQDGSREMRGNGSFHVAHPWPSRVQIKLPQLLKPIQHHKASHLHPEHVASLNQKFYLLLQQWTLFCLLNVFVLFRFFKSLTRLNCFRLLQRDVACLF